MHDTDEVKTFILSRKILEGGSRKLMSYLKFKGSMRTYKILEFISGNMFLGN